MRASLTALTALTLLSACLGSAPGGSVLPVAAELDGTRLRLDFPGGRRCEIEALPASIEGETWYGEAPRCRGVEHVSVRHPRRPIRMPDGTYLATLEVPPTYVVEGVLTAPNRPAGAPAIKVHVETTGGAVRFATPAPG